MAASLPTRLQALADRLEANRRVVDLVREQSDFQQICDRQKLLFHHAMQAMPLISHAEAASLASAVRAVGWPSDEVIINFVLSHVMEVQAKPRVTLQDYTTSEHYLPAVVWQSGPDTFVDNMCEFLAVRLGLQHASEHTFQKLAALGMLAMYSGRDGAMHVTCSVKRGIVDAIKTSLKRHRGYNPN